MVLARRALAVPPFAALLPRDAGAQGEFPSRNPRFIVPFPPGAASDVLARIVAPRRWRTAAAPAPADGHTILLAALPFVINHPLVGLVLSHLPLALAEHLQARAVGDEVQRFAVRAAAGTTPSMSAPFGSPPP